MSKKQKNNGGKGEAAPLPVTLSADEMMTVAVHLCETHSVVDPYGQLQRCWGVAENQRQLADIYQGSEFIVRTFAAVVQNALRAALEDAVFNTIYPHLRPAVLAFTKEYEKARKLAENQAEEASKIFARDSLARP